MKVMEKFPRSKQLRNYSNHPTINVDILPEGPRHCRDCGEEVIYDRELGYGGRWRHSEPGPDHYVRPVSRCVYCGVQSEELLKYRQHAWYDAVECARCGGVDGYAIGD